jgi:hypothetical protein
MDLIFKSQDLLCLLIIPIMFVTIQQVKQNWASLWDDNLTAKDRAVLLQASLFLLEPLVVLCHELGHAAATVAFGGKVVEFHFAILSGYVVPEGDFNQVQLLLIYLAGNAVTISIGYLCLLCALFVRSPARVAVLVYLGMWSVASSAVFYTLMSLLGFYGDWIAIYTSPEHSLVYMVAACHVVIVASLAYMLMGKKPRLWFACKTRPTWALKFLVLGKELTSSPNKQTLMKLAWLCYEADLNDFAREYANKCLGQDSEDPEPQILLGHIDLSRQKFDKAQAAFERVAKSERASELLKARAYMYIAQSRLIRSEVERRDPEIANQEALQSYAYACGVAPNLGDPYFRHAELLNKLGRYADALAEFEALEERIQTASLNWLDPTLPRKISAQLRIAASRHLGT